MKRNVWKKLVGLFLMLAMVLTMFTGCGGAAEDVVNQAADAVESAIDEEFTISAEEEAAGYEDTDEQTDDAQAEEDDAEEDDAQVEDAKEEQIAEDGEYTSKDDVALYIYTYGHLPSNFITKKEAKALGWDSKAGNLSEVAPGKSIGGDYFGNYEGILPDKKGRKYTECDIDSTGGYRGAKRIIFSNQGQIYYTEDHYETFTLLYGEE